MKVSKQDFLFFFETSLLVTAVGVFLHFLFSMSIVLFAPLLEETPWVQPSSYYQVQMYEVADSHLYVGSAGTSSRTLMFVHHLKKGKILSGFSESDNIKIMAPPELEKYITKMGEKLKLTSQVLLLRKPEGHLADEAEAFRKKLQENWEKQPEPWPPKVNYEILELYSPNLEEAFAIAETDGVLESFTDKFKILDEETKEKYFSDPGVVYVRNPREFRISRFQTRDGDNWQFDPRGERIEDLSQLTGKLMGFRSRKELIEHGEDIFAKEGCWYCHTDQTRTLVQDLVLNGSESYPAPPSSPNEYIYQQVTFPGTRRIGLDLSRVGIKRPSRDWHRSHFWSPKTASVGTIMPAFKHFFDSNPTGTSPKTTGVPDYKFEAVFQYLMTKGTRITPPTEAWWLGKDPIKVLEIIEGRKTL
jgi:cytochrome c oxidase cbb3-type subunit 2